MTISTRAALAGMICAAALTALVGSPGRMEAANDDWIAGDGIYSNTANWATGALPGTTATDNAVFGTNGSNYTVTFNRNEIAGNLWMTNNNTVTFDLAGHTFALNTALPARTSATIGPNGVDTTTLVLSNGTLNMYNVGARQKLFPYAHASLTLTNGGRLLVNYLDYNGTLGGAVAGSDGRVLVAGPGSYLVSEVEAGFNPLAGSVSLTVQDGAGMLSGDTRVNQLTIDGGSVTNGRGRYISQSGGFVTVVHGGTFVMGGNSAEISLQNPASFTGVGSVTVGDGTGPGTSRMMLYAGAGIVANVNQESAALNNPTTDFRIGSDGLVHYEVLSGTGSFNVNQNATLTLNGGRLEIQNGSQLLINTTNRAGLVAAVLRGQGTIAVTGAGTQNFVLNNVGRIRPGDTSATPAIGTLTLDRGHLYQTNSANNPITYFEFSPTANDQIVISNGLALITGGTNSFAVAAGAPTPKPGEKYGIGVFDFIVATNITYNPSVRDNLVNLLTNTYHLTYGVDFQYGVVDLHNGLFALELAFVPEPSTVLLLALGGLMIWRRAAKKARR